MYTSYIYFLLNKKASGDLSDEEERILSKWFDALNFPTHQSVNDLDQLRMMQWSELREKMTALPRHQDVPASTRRNFIIRNMRWMAAASVIILAGIFYYYFSENKTASRQTAYITIPSTAQKKLVELPDGSKVWLNQYSQLRYANNFSDERNIILDFGEAFFEVQKDTVHPFTVTSNRLAIRVVGTAFNVQAYSQLDEVKVTVSHGLVRVTDSTVCNELLGANQRLVYNRSTRRAQVGKIDGQKANDWKDGNIYLQNISSRELAVYLKNIYGYEVVFENSALEECKNTINFNENDSISEVLNILKIINHISYKIIDKKIYITGSGCK